MSRLRIIVGIGFVCLAAHRAGAQGTIDPNAQIVLLRQSCGSTPNCFSEQGSAAGSIADVTAWIDSTRHPSSTNPLLVDIGTGTFTGEFSCFDPWFVTYSGPLPSGNTGHVTFRGAGRDQTTLQSDLYVGFGCVDLEFRDLRLQGQPGDPEGIQLNFAISKTTWIDVDVNLGSWYEEHANCIALDGVGFTPTHTWLDSNITTERTGLLTGNSELDTADQGIAYAATCDQTRFYGGSITVLPGSLPAGSAPTSLYSAVAAGERGEFYGFGTKITARIAGRPALHSSDPNVPAALYGGIADLWTVLGIQGQAGGEIVLEGGEVIVDGTAVATQPVVGFLSAAAGKVETSGTTFSLQGAVGSSTRRLVGPSTAFDSLVFHLPDSNVASFASVLGDYPPSLSGQDAYAQSGCSSSGLCDGSGSQVHLMVSDSTCASSSEWRDQVTGECAVVTVVDNCPTIYNPSQADQDADGVGDACDNCVSVANPRITPLSFERTTGGQLDDDQDGYGNRCDGDFDNNGSIDATDNAAMTASQGKLRSGSNCGSGGSLACSLFDLDGTGAVIGSADLAIFRQLGSTPGPKCPVCPLP